MKIVCRSIVEGVDGVQQKPHACCGDAKLAG